MSFQPKRVLDLGFIAVQIGEEVIPHGNGAVVLMISGVLEANLGPRVDGKAAVFLTSTVITCNKVRLRSHPSLPEIALWHTWLV